MHQKHYTDINTLNHIFNSAGFPTGVANIGGAGAPQNSMGRA